MLMNEVTQNHNPLGAERLEEGSDGNSILLTILNAMPDMIFRIDLDFTVVWGNSAAIDRCNHLVGNKCYEILNGRDEPCKGCSCPKSLETGQTETGIVDATAYRNGTPSFFENVSSPLRSSTGEITGLIVISRDVTRRELATQKLEDYTIALQHAKHEAENANIQKSRFMANMSHELRTPMNGIMGMAQLLRMTNLDDSQRDYVTLLNQSCVRLVEIVDGISELSKNENHIEKSSRVLFSIKGIIDEMRSMFEVKAVKKGVVLKMDIDENMPEKVIGDSYRIHQALSNIIDNAIKFTEYGHVTLSAKLLGRTEEELNLLLTVTDTGSGIPAELLPSIFERFNNNVAVGDNETQHIGFGLSVTKHLVDIMKGDIAVTSNTAEGTIVTMRVTLGYVNEEKRKTEDKQGNHNAVKSNANQPASGRRKILVAEDEVMNRLTFKMALKDDYDLVFAKNGKEAVDLYNKEKPDLVLLDIMMPIMDGFQVLDEIEKKGGNRVPVIACTARLVESEPEYLKGYGFNDYISKPVELSLLKKIIERHLGV